MAKDPKFIKVKFDKPKPVAAPLPAIADLVLNFASDAKVFTIRVKASEMEKMARAFCDLMSKYSVVYSIEEKPR